jgi:hypothetical protein
MAPAVDRAELVRQLEGHGIIVGGIDDDTAAAIAATGPTVGYLLRLADGSRYVPYLDPTAEVDGERLDATDLDRNIFDRFDRFDEHGPERDGWSEGVDGSHYLYLRARYIPPF